MLSEELKTERAALQAEYDANMRRQGDLMNRICTINRLERLEQEVEDRTQKNKALYRLRAMLYDRGKMMRVLTDQPSSDLNKLGGNEWRSYLASMFKVTEDGYRYDFYSLPQEDQILLRGEARRICKEIRENRKAQWLATRSAGLPENDFLGLTVDEWKTRRSEATAE